LHASPCARTCTHVRALNNTPSRAHALTAWHARMTRRHVARSHEGMTALVRCRRCLTSRSPSRPPPSAAATTAPGVP
jgi:hypothetical protein